MPQIGVFIAATIGTTVGAGLSLGTLGAIATVINTALLVGASFGLAALTRPKLKIDQTKELVVRSGASPKQVVYGEAVVGGVLAYMNQKPISGNRNYELWACIVHHATEAEDITDLYYDSDELTSGGEITWSSNTSDVNSGPWHADDATHEASTVWKFLGTAAQTLPTDFTSAFSELNANHRLRGYAGTIHRWTIFDESEELFAGGQPQNIRAKVRGRKVYDPRLQSPIGNDPDAAGALAWTDNPILIAADYCRTFWNFASDRFDWSYIAAQADLCDVLVSVPPSSPATTQKRYTCNGAISLGDSHDNNLAAILQTCLGTRTMVNGLIRFTVGGYVTPDVTLDETDIIGPVKVRTALPRNERFNRVSGTYVAELDGYTETNYQPVENAAFVTRDNGETITKDIDFSMVVNEYQAQRLAYFALQQSDQQITIELPLRWSGLRLTPGTYVQLTYDKLNYTNKVFRVQQLKIGERGVPVTAVMREDASSAWTDPVVGDYTTKTANGTVVPATPVTPPPTSLAATAEIDGIELSWVNPSQRNNWDYIDVYASETSGWNDSPLTRTRIATGITDERYFHRLTNTETRYYWARAVHKGIESDREPNSDTTTITATALNQGAVGALDTVRLGPSGEVANEAGDNLADIDLRNDQLVISAFSGGQLANPGFSIPRVGVTGDPVPASWFGTNSNSHAIQYEIPTAHDVLYWPSDTDGAACRVISAAFPIPDDTRTYEIYLLAKYSTGGSPEISSGSLNINIHQTTANLATGERAVYGGVASGTQSDSTSLFHSAVAGSPSVSTIKNVNNQPLTSTYTVYNFTYTPDTGTLWASLGLWPIGDTTKSPTDDPFHGNVHVEWAIIHRN